MFTQANSEWHSPMPDGYKPGQVKYIVVLGTVMSGLGKGIFGGSLARVLQERGLSVAPLKLEGYLNMDSGTLNPVRHGEVFVLDGGLECDMDLGNYERLLNVDLGEDNFVTSGQIFASVLKRERSGGYLGRDVQMVPHVTGEIKLRLRRLATKSGADIVFIEIGGTVGDLENGHYIEACRQLAAEEGNVCFVALTYAPSPSSLGEQKSKPAQLGLRQLMSLGVMPDIIAVRSDHEVSRTVLEKLSLFGGVPLDRVFGMHDVKSVCLVPDMIRDAGLGKAVLKIFGLDAAKRSDRDAYAAMFRRTAATGKRVKIGIAGKYISLRDAYASVLHALEHAAVEAGVNVDVHWIDTETIDDSNVAMALSQADIDGLIVPGGFGLRGIGGKMACIRYARDTLTPFLGMCYGFQMAIIEFARNRCNLPATSGEIDADSKCKVVDILPGQSPDRVGGTMRLGGHDVLLRPGTLASSLYLDAARCRQRFRHRYEMVPEYVSPLEEKGLVFSGSATDGTGTKQVFELPAHPFFLATQGHPELTSRPSYPDPMFRGFMKAVLERSQK